MKTEIKDINTLLSKLEKARPQIEKFIDWEISLAKHATDNYIPFDICEDTVNKIKGEYENN